MNVHDLERMISSYRSSKNSIFDQTWSSYLEILTSSNRYEENIKFESQDVLIIIDMQKDFVPYSHRDTVSTFGVLDGNSIVVPIAELCKSFLSSGYVIATRDYHPKDHVSFLSEGGPFPQHCVQGTEGSEIVPRIAKSLLEYTAHTPPQLHKNASIVFKGFDANVDSFAASRYVKKNRGLCKNHYHCNTRSGAFELQCSGHHVIDQSHIFGSADGFMPGTGNVNAPPDVGFDFLNGEAYRMENKKEIKSASSIFIVGLALDFCVVDTAINLSLKYAQKNIYIVLDLTRPAFVDVYLTEPNAFMKLLHNSQVKFCLKKDINNLPKLDQNSVAFAELT